MAKDPVGADSAATADAAGIIANAEVQAKKIIADAKEQAEEILAAAQSQVSTAAEVSGLTKAEAAKLVQREVLVPAKEKGGNPTLQKVTLLEAEVLSFKDYGDSVVVVTTDGQKLTGAK
jgi:regulator of protease activity HflC (stomatin/prohibitin superfamily)